MAERGFMMINAPDGAVIATIERDANEAGRYAEMAFDRFGISEQPARMFATMVNLMHWETLGRPNLAISDELLTDLAFFPSSEDDDGAAGHYMAAMRDSGFSDAMWGVKTWNGEVWRIAGSRRRMPSRPAIKRRATPKRAPACTCRGR